MVSFLFFFFPPPSSRGGVGGRRVPDNGKIDLFKACHCCFEIFDDVVGQYIGVRQIVQIGQAFVFQPEDIQAGFVAVDDFVIGELAPAAFRIGFRVPRFFALMPVCGL